SGVFRIFAHQLYDHFHHALGVYESQYKGSSRPFYFSVFSAATFYLGNKPRRVMDDDLAWGWSAITALGDFNASNGGHIILWDLNLVVRLPAGSTILIPRALIRYSFVRIAPGESRYSLVQFTPAPIFRFAANGGRSDLDFARDASEKEHLDREARREAAQDGHIAQEMYSDLSELSDAYYSFPIPPPPPGRA
ncbi:hypothetical protein B0H15DRAFT_794783, partial [Mycena belliarum]